MFKFGNFVAAIALSVASISGAHASTFLSGVFNVTAVNVSGVNSTQSRATEANYLAALAGTLGGTVNGSDTFTYDGALGFEVGQPQTAVYDIGTWLGTAGGSTTDLASSFADLQLSFPNINNGTATTTFFLFERQGALTAGDYDVRHDDGFAIFIDGVRAGGVNGPTGVRNSVVNGASGGQFSLLYVATNGNPSVLQVNTTASPVPLPAALPMLLAAMGGLGWMARRRRAA